MRRRVLVTAAAGVAILGLIAFVAYLQWFAPEGSTQADEPLPDLGAADGTAGQDPDSGSASGSASTPTPLRQGAFKGADGFHFAEGTVALYQASNGTYLLRFEGYDAREGPDVYLYLTREAGGSNAAEVEGQGLRLRVPGGAEDGRATVRGTFNVFLPAGTDALAYHGVTIWCDQFDQYFGHAPLA